MEYFKSKIRRRKKISNCRKIKIGRSPYNCSINDKYCYNNLEATVTGKRIRKCRCWLNEYPVQMKNQQSLKKIIDRAKVPIIADIHFHSQRAIEAAEAEHLV